MKQRMQAARGPHETQQDGSGHLSSHLCVRSPVTLCPLWGTGCIAIAARASAVLWVVSVKRCLHSERGRVRTTQSSAERIEFPVDASPVLAAPL